jgi:hypothetical protein
MSLRDCRAYAARFAVTALFLAALTACQNLNPLAVAQTPAQKYAAVKLTYDALLTPAVDLVEDTTAPIDLRRNVQRAVASSGEAFKSLNTAYVDYVAARATLAQGATTSEKLELATANLEQWVSTLESDLGNIARLLDR